MTKKTKMPTVNNETLMRMLRGESPAFLFTSGGAIQFWKEPNRIGPIVATSRKAAAACAADLRRNTGKRISIAEVGTVPGESLTRQLAVAVLYRGATGVFVTDDGETDHFFQAPPFPE